MVGVAMMGISAMEIVASTITRITVLYPQKGPGIWMMAALWGTAFQVVIIPTRWALEWGETQGEAVSRRILSRVGGANLPADREGALPSTKSLSTVGRTQDLLGYSCSAAKECAAEAIFCCPTENSRHLEA
jgi:hypothetical protein